MKHKLFCQSCSIPMDHVRDMGTEKDGSTCQDYCKYCYRDGSFMNPDLTFGEMKSIVTILMLKTYLPGRIIHQLLNSLPYLKRWRGLQLP